MGWFQNTVNDKIFFDSWIFNDDKDLKGKVSKVYWPTGRHPPFLDVGGVQRLRHTLTGPKISLQNKENEK